VPQPASRMRALMLKTLDIPVDDTTSSFSGEQLGEK
jgi:hypothetical protein